MPKRFHADTTNIVFHAFNRAVRGTVLFTEPSDYSAFERILCESVERTGIRLLAYCLMPNHWHLVVWPSDNRQLIQCMHWLTSTHAKRWQTYRRQIGTGAVYQSRYKAIPVQTEQYFLTLCRYVERNALRAGLVARAEAWPWGSLAAREKNCHAIPLSVWPILRPEPWVELVNGAQADTELKPIRSSVQTGKPLGDDEWAATIRSRLGDRRQPRRGRPRRKDAGFNFG